MDTIRDITGGEIETKNSTSDIDGHLLDGSKAGCPQDLADSGHVITMAHVKAKTDLEMEHLENNLSTVELGTLKNKNTEELTDRSWEDLTKLLPNSDTQLSDKDDAFSVAESLFGENEHLSSSSESFEILQSSEVEGSDQAACHDDSSQSTIDRTLEVPSSNVQEQETDPIVLYHIVTIPGKGQGMIAAKPIPRGTLILVEMPLIKLDRYSPSVFPRLQFAKLSSTDKDRVLSLHNCRGDRGDIMGIIWTNAIPIPCSHDSGLFINASRINHACNPNTHQSSIGLLGELRIFATRDIGEGEEITSTYINGHAIYRMRRAHLQDRLGFTCRCWMCSLSPADRIRSDERINRINDIERHCYQLSMLNTEPIMGLRLLHKLLRLYEEESIVDHRPAHALAKAFDFAVFAADGRRALILIEYAAALMAEVEGEDGYETIRLKKLAKETKKMMQREIHGEFSLGGEQPLVLQGQAFWDWLFCEEDCISYSHGTKSSAAKVVMPKGADAEVEKVR